jgi:hypothetical protein
MRKLAVLVVFPALVALPGVSLAQTATPNQPQTQNAQPPQAIQQKVQKNLQDAGFTDIHIMPSSFLVRAKDKDGNPVMMVINPDSVTAVTAIPGPGRTTGQGSSSQPSQSPGNSSGASPMK